MSYTSNYDTYDFKPMDYVENGGRVYRVVKQKGKYLITETETFNLDKHDPILLNGPVIPEDDSIETLWINYPETKPYKKTTRKSDGTITTEFLNTVV